RPETAGELTLHLVKDDAPIQGRILNLQGEPVAGATVRIDRQFFAPLKSELTDWLKKLQTDKGSPHQIGATEFAELASPTVAMLFPPVTTGADGRFTLKGIGRERIVSLHVQGPTIATQTFKAMTRDFETI